MNRRRARAVVPLLGIAVLAGCATEVDPDITVPPTGASTTTTQYVAGGTPAELVEQLQDEADSLSEAVVDGEGEAEILGRIDAVWEAVRPEVEAVAADQMLEFDRAVVALHTGVERRRPADVDKTANTLRRLIAALPTL